MNSISVLEKEDQDQLKDENALVINKKIDIVFKDKVTVEMDTPAPKTKTRFHISNFVKGKKTTAKVMWSKIVQARFQLKDPTKMYFKYDYNEEFMTAEFCSRSSVLKKKKIPMHCKKEYLIKSMLL